MNPKYFLIWSLCAFLASCLSTDKRSNVVDLSGPSDPDLLALDQDLTLKAVYHSPDPSAGLSGLVIPQLWPYPEVTVTFPKGKYIRVRKEGETGLLFRGFCRFSFNDGKEISKTLAVAEMRTSRKRYDEGRRTYDYLTYRAVVSPEFKNKVLPESEQKGTSIIGMIAPKADEKISQVGDRINQETSKVIDLLKPPPPPPPNGYVVGFRYGENMDVSGGHPKYTRHPTGVPIRYLSINTASGAASVGQKPDDSN